MEALVDIVLYGGSILAFRAFLRLVYLLYTTLGKNSTEEIEKDFSSVGKHSLKQREHHK